MSARESPLDVNCYRQTLVGAELCVLHGKVNRNLATLSEPRLSELKNISLITTAHDPKDGIPIASSAFNAAPNRAQLNELSGQLALTQSVAFLQRLSISEIQALYEVGKRVLTQGVSADLDLVRGYLRNIEAGIPLVNSSATEIVKLDRDLVDQIATKLINTRSKEVLKFNALYPDNWRGVLPNIDLASDAFERLSSQAQNDMRRAVYSTAIALAALPDASMQLVNDLARQRARLGEWVEPAALLPDYVYKQIMQQQFLAWRLRKKLLSDDKGSHPYADKNFSQLPVSEKLFSGLMGISVVQSLREVGREPLECLVEFGKQAIAQGQIDVACWKRMLETTPCLHSIPFTNGNVLSLSQELTQHLAQLHHGHWRANRGLTFLLPDKLLHQPYMHAKDADKPSNVLPIIINNESCVQVLCQAIALAHDIESDVRSKATHDIIESAALGNPLAIDSSISSNVI